MLSYLPAMDIQLANKTETRWVLIESHVRPVLAVKGKPRPKHDHELVFTFETVRFDSEKEENVTLDETTVSAAEFSERYQNYLTAGWTLCP